MVEWLSTAITESTREVDELAEAIAITWRRAGQAGLKDCGDRVTIAAGHPPDHRKRIRHWDALIAA